MGGLPSPSVLIGIPKFDHWYPNQDFVFSRVLDWYSSGGRFLGVSCPTGSGKSLLAILASKLLGARTCILTATKGLQDQIIGDFSSVGVVSVRGQNNFVCTMVPNLRADEAPCHEGMGCFFRPSGGCPYYEQLSRALAAPVVVTNYAYYLAQTRFSSGLGDFDLLVLDEAHLAFNALEAHLSVYLVRSDIESMGITVPRQDIGWPEWQAWAGRAIPVVAAVLDQLSEEVNELRSTGRVVPGSLSRRLRTVKSVARGLGSLSSAAGRWVIQEVYHGWRFTPLWLAEYSGTVFQNAPKVMLMSAILSEKTMDSLGVTSEAREIVSVGSSFPSQNTPVWHVPSVRINYSTDSYGLSLWLARIDQIIERRLDRKGIVFTVSYKRRDLLLQRSRFADIMVSHSTRDVTEMVRRFKAMDPPAVLVSPAVTSGWDFPGLDYIVVGKIPYPDTQDPVIVARQESDKEWSSFMAMETLVQECGRGTRSQSDRCEVLIVDDSWRWYWPKYRKYAPKWFQERVRGSLESVPDPLV